MAVMVVYFSVYFATLFNPDAQSTDLYNDLGNDDKSEIVANDPRQ